MMIAVVIAVILFVIGLFFIAIADDVNAWNLRYEKRTREEREAQAAREAELDAIRDRLHDYL